MNIGGFLPLSLCDFPGKVAAVVFTNGCNFRCPWCHNGHLVNGASCPEYSELDADAVIARIGELKNRLQGVVVSGGEPTLQLDLKAFLRTLKSFGLLVKLDTNGGRPDIVRELIADKLVDFIAMDIKAPWAKYSLLTGLKESPAELVRETMEIIVSSGLPHQFRTTKVTPLLTEEDCAEIERQLPEGEKVKWQTFNSEKVLTPEAFAPV